MILVQDYWIDKMTSVNKLEVLSFCKYFRVDLRKDANPFKLRREKWFAQEFKGTISLGLDFTDFDSNVFTVRENHSVLVQLPQVNVLDIKVGQESFLGKEYSEEVSILEGLAFELTIRKCEMDDCYAKAQEVIRRRFVSVLNSLGFHDIQIIFPKENHPKLYPNADKAKDESNPYFLAIDGNDKQYIQYKNGTKKDFPAGVVSWRDKILFADKYQ